MRNTLQKIEMTPVVIVSVPYSDLIQSTEDKVQKPLTSNSIAQRFTDLLYR